MSKYLRKCFGEPTVLITTGINDIKTALYFQTGFKNVSGHVDVIYNGNVGKKMYTTWSNKYSGFALKNKKKRIL